MPSTVPVHRRAFVKRPSQFLPISYMRRAFLPVRIERCSIMFRPLRDYNGSTRVDTWRGHRPPKLMRPHH